MKELIEIQKELIAPKGRTGQHNTHHRHVDDILMAVKPLLIKKNCTLTLTDDMVLVGDRVYLKATAIITNGTDTVESSSFAREPIALGSMSDPQITGSCSSYARKYALGGLLLIDDNADPDKIDNQLNPARPMTEEQENKLLGYLDRLNDEKSPAAAWLSGKMGDGMTDVKATSVIRQIEEKMGW